MGFFVYTMSQVQARARTKAGIWRMYIIETIVEMMYKVYESSRSQPTRLYTMSQVQARALFMVYFVTGRHIFYHECMY